MDFEEELELNYIRKEEIINQNNVNQKDTCTGKSKPRIVYCIPLLLKHIHLLEGKVCDKHFYTVMANGEHVRLQRCLVYGRIMSKNISNEKCIKFILDDSSDTIQVLAFNNDLYSVLELSNEVTAVEQTPLGQTKSDIIRSMKNIVSKMQGQVNYAQIPLGAKVLVCGQLYFCNNRKALKAKFILQAISYLEIETAFKKFLIDNYQKIL